MKNKKLVSVIGVLVFALVLVTAGYSVTEYSRCYALRIQGPDSSYTGALQINDSTGTEVFSVDSSGNMSSAGNLSAASTVTFEGSTADAYETVLTVEDPTIDQTPTIVNAIAASPTFVLSVGDSGDISATTATNTTVDAYTQTVAAGVLGAGDWLKFTYRGEKSATNAAGGVGLQLGTAGAEATIFTNTIQSGDTDFCGEILIHVIKTGSAFVSGKIIGNTASGASGDAYITQYTTKDFLTEAVSAQVIIQSEHGSDIVKLYDVDVQQW